MDSGQQQRQTDSRRLEGFWERDTCRVLLFLGSRFDARDPIHVEDDGSQLGRIDGSRIRLYNINFQWR